MFSDEKTFIKLEDQDYSTNHDCDPSAKIPVLYQNPVDWKRIMTYCEYTDSNTTL